MRLEVWSAYRLDSCFVLYSGSYLLFYDRISKKLFLIFKKQVPLSPHFIRRPCNHQQFLFWLDERKSSHKNVFLFPLLVSTFYLRKISCTKCQWTQIAFSSKFWIRFNLVFLQWLTSVCLSSWLLSSLR